MARLDRAPCDLHDAGTDQAGQFDGCLDIELSPGDERNRTIAGMSGIFYCGDNLEILTALDLVPAESVDLIYLDPPFNSQRTYNIVYKDSRAQAEAFKDHWSWQEAAPQYARLLDASETPPKLRTLLRGLHDLLIDDDADLLAYLAMMAPRIFALHRVLKPTGSLYLHCDPTASHYLKLVLDAVFGAGRFRSEIVWKRSGAHSDTKQGRKLHGHIHDTVLFYTKSDEWTWNDIFTPYGDSYVGKDYRLVEEGTGRRFRRDNLTAARPGGDTSYEWRVKKPRNKKERWVADLDDGSTPWREGSVTPSMACPSTNAISTRCRASHCKIYGPTSSLPERRSGSDTPRRNHWNSWRGLSDRPQTKGALCSILSAVAELPSKHVSDSAADGSGST